MAAEFDQYYEALVSKDARFDGRFFVGVMSTGIYCRPVCPARTPKAKNVRFFPCAAAAEEAGLRPCLRCHPEAAPGTPAWVGTSATVSRGMRLIETGALDDGQVDDLAGRLGMGARQLRRLFAEHLGASPIAIAKHRRVAFARKLIDASNLPMTQVAFSSGYSSIRQFNQAIKQSFGQSPTMLRRAAQRNGHRIPTGPDAAGGLTIRLPFRPPLDWAGLLAFFRMRAVPGIESVDARSYRRTVRVGNTAGTIEVRRADEDHYLVLRIRVDAGAELMGLVDRVRAMFDLGADPLRIAEHLRHDPRLRPSVRSKPGLRVPGAWDGFELAVRAVLGQQVSVAGATTVAGRLVAAFGDPLAEHDDACLTHLFPQPNQLAEADLSTVGIIRSRAKAIRELARRVCDGTLVIDASADPEETMTQLCDVPGIGPWTAQYVAMRALHEPDAFPASDLGLLQALADNGRPMTAGALLKQAEAWRPWRAYAAMHLWRIRARKESR